MATAENNVAAARPSKRRETSVVRVGIDSSVLLFLIASFDSESRVISDPCDQTLFRPGNGAKQFHAKLAQKKRRRGTNRSALRDSASQAIRSAGSPRVPNLRRA